MLPNSSFVPTSWLHLATPLQELWRSPALCRSLCGLRPADREPRAPSSAPPQWQLSPSGLAAPRPAVLARIRRHGLQSRFEPARGGRRGVPDPAATLPPTPAAVTRALHGPGGPSTEGSALRANRRGNALPRSDRLPLRYTSPKRDRAGCAAAARQCQARSFSEPPSRFSQRRLRGSGRGMF